MKVKKTLRNIAWQCTGDDVPECPIIDALLDSSDQLAFSAWLMYVPTGRRPWQPRTGNAFDLQKILAFKVT